MAYVIDKNECIGCGTCAENCPFNAIAAADDKYEIDPKVCEECGACADACPVGAISN